MKTRPPLLRRPRFRLAKQRAAEFLKASRVHRPPGPVERIRSVAGATIRDEPFAGQLEWCRSSDVTGLNHRRQFDAPIGSSTVYDSSRASVILSFQQDDLFHVDEKFPVAFRREDSSKANSPSEVEANQFAAELLMPQELLMRDVAKLPHGARRRGGRYAAGKALRSQRAGDDDPIVCSWRHPVRRLLPPGRSPAAAAPSRHHGWFTLPLPWPRRRFQNQPFGSAPFHRRCTRGRLFVNCSAPTMYVTLNLPCRAKNRGFTSRRTTSANQFAAFVTSKTKWPT